MSHEDRCLPDPGLYRLTYLSTDMLSKPARTQPDTSTILHTDSNFGQSLVITMLFGNEGISCRSDDSSSSNGSKVKPYEDATEQRTPQTSVKLMP
jgi:hypothetical protein